MESGEGCRERSPPLVNVHALGAPRVPGVPRKVGRLEPRLVEVVPGLVLVHLALADDLCRELSEHGIVLALNGGIRGTELEPVLQNRTTIERLAIDDEMKTLW